MNFIEPVPYFREMSPEVPKELLAQLETGDLPPAYADDQNPVAQMFRRYWKIRNANRVDVARALARGTNISKNLRRIDAVLSGESHLPFWITGLMQHLDIPPEELAAAETEALSWKESRKLAEVRRTRHRFFRRLGPYLASVNTISPFSTPAQPGYSPHKLHSVLDNPLLSEVREWVLKQPSQARGKFRITAYLYHRLPDEIYFFETRENPTERCP